MDVKQSAKECFIGKSVKLYPLKCDRCINLKEEMYSADPTLTRKVSSDVVR